VKDDKVVLSKIGPLDPFQLFMALAISLALKGRVPRKRVFNTGSLNTEKLQKI
jgi:hypothetical protein